MRIDTRQCDLCQKQWQPYEHNPAWYLQFKVDTNMYLQVSDCCNDCWSRIRETLQEAVNECKKLVELK